MTNNPSAQAQGFAELRTEFPTTPGFRLLPDAVVAAILALLDHLLAHLEALLLQWRAGQLPPPAVARTLVRDRAPASKTTPMSTRARHQPARRSQALPPPDLGSPVRAPQDADATTRHRPPTFSAPPAAPPRLRGESPPVFPAFRGRAPPSRQNSPESAPPNRAVNVTISKLTYRFTSHFLAIRHETV